MNENSYKAVVWMASSIVFVTVFLAAMIAAGRLDSVDVGFISIR